MSATIEVEKFMEFFNTTNIVRVKGRTFPTQIYNLLEPTPDYLESAFNSIFQIHCEEKEGDILVFLTGEEEILNLHKKICKGCE